MTEDGQSTVEYLLLLAVVITVVTTFFGSARFRQYFGEGGRLATELREDVEWKYRHGVSGRGLSTTIQYPNGTHPTYWNGSTTRFFSAREPYP